MKQPTFWRKIIKKAIIIYQKSTDLPKQIGHKLTGDRFVFNSTSQGAVTL